MSHSKEEEMQLDSNNRNDGMQFEQISLIFISCTLGGDIEEMAKDLESDRSEFECYH